MNRSNASAIQLICFYAKVEAHIMVHKSHKCFRLTSTVC